MFMCEMLHVGWLIPTWYSLTARMELHTAAAAPGAKGIFAGSFEEMPLEQLFTHEQHLLGIGHMDR